MRRPELDQALTTILASQPEVSDVIFTVDRPPQVEAYGELKPVILDPPIQNLTPFQVEIEPPPVAHGHGGDHGHGHA